MVPQYLYSASLLSGVGGLHFLGFDVLNNQESPCFIKDYYYYKQNVINRMMSFVSKTVDILGFVEIIIK